MTTALSEVPAQHPSQPELPVTDATLNDEFDHFPEPDLFAEFDEEPRWFAPPVRAHDAEPVTLDMFAGLVDEPARQPQSVTAQEPVTEPEAATEPVCVSVPEPDPGVVPLVPERFVVLDTETTGLSPRTERIVEVAALEFDPLTGVTGQAFHAYLNPDKLIPDKLTQLHGISNAMVAHQPRFSDRAAELLAFLSGATVIAHNAPFDVGFLDSELERAGLPPLADHVGGVVCSLALARQTLPGQKASLDALCDHFRIDRRHRTQHGALVDCQLLAEVYPRLTGALPPNPAPVPSVSPAQVEPTVQTVQPVAALPRPSWLQRLGAWLVLRP